MSVCPVCNSLFTVNKKCPFCGHSMHDTGVIQDFYDGYSSYLEQDIYKNDYGAYFSDFCVHLFACPNCHFDTNIKIRCLN